MAKTKAEEVFENLPDDQPPVAEPATSQPFDRSGIARWTLKAKFTSDEIRDIDQAVTLYRALKPYGADMQPAEAVHSMVREWHLRTLEKLRPKLDD